MAKITLFDLTNVDGNGPWSPFSWKVRLSLNYKDVDYTSKFLDYPQVADTLKALPGVEAGDPAKGNGAAYTIPTVQFADGTAVMESKAIVRKLEEIKPSPSLSVEDPIVAEAEAAIDQFGAALHPVYMVKFLNVLTPPSAEYFEKGREKAMGMTVQELAKTKGGEPAWQNAQPAIETIAKLLKRHDGGPFLLGSKPCYGDFVIAGYWHCMLRVDKSIFDRVTKTDPSLLKQYEACEEWFKKQQD